MGARAHTRKCVPVCAYLCACAQLKPTDLHVYVETVVQSLRACMNTCAAAQVRAHITRVSPCVCMASAHAGIQACVSLSKHFD